MLTEEGIAKGVRRIVAVTKQDAMDAIAAADELDKQIQAANSMDVADLDRVLGGLKAAVDQATIPFVRKAEMRDQLAGLQRKALEAAKALAAKNREVAIARVTEAAQAAASLGSKFLVAALEVGTDAKAISDAIAAVAKLAADMSVMVVSSDTDKGRVMVSCAVSDAGQKLGLAANDWSKTALEVLGGKGGGKAASAMGQGTEVAKVGEAVSLATQFAKAKLG